MSSAEILEEETENAVFILPTWRDFLSGTCAGVSITIVGHPFDTVKVRLQTQDLMRTDSLGGKRFKGGMDCVMRTVRREGVLALFKGMEAPMLTVPAINAIVFAAYEQGVQFFVRNPLDNDPSLPVDQSRKKMDLSMREISLAGGWAGLVNSMIVGPVELIKSRLQVQYDSKSSKGRLMKGPLDVIRNTIKYQGVRGIFQGMNITILREVPAYMAQFYTYEYLKRLFTPEGQTPQDLGPIPLMMAGGLAGMGAWLWSYPQDVIKSRIQIQRVDRPSRYPSRFFDGGMISCARSIYKSKGWKGFTVGFGPCAARALPANAAGFLTYELVSRMMKEDA